MATAPPVAPMIDRLVYSLTTVNCRRGVFRGPGAWEQIWRRKNVLKFNVKNYAKF